MLSDALSYANVALGGAVCICVLNLLGNAVRGTGNMSLHASVPSAACWRISPSHPC